MTETHKSARKAVLTVDETADFLRISRQSAYQGVRNGEIPAVRIGRRLLVPRHALLALVGAPSDFSAEEKTPAEA